MTNNKHNNPATTRPASIQPSAKERARAEYDRARADRDRARAEYDRARAEYKRTPTETARTKTETARAEYDRARAEYKRIQARERSRERSRIKTAGKRDAVKPLPAERSIIPYRARVNPLPAETDRERRARRLTDAVYTFGGCNGNNREYLQLCAVDIVHTSLTAGARSGQQLFIDMLKLCHYSTTADYSDTTAFNRAHAVLLELISTARVNVYVDMTADERPPAETETERRARARNDAYAVWYGYPADRAFKAVNEVMYQYRRNDKKAVDMDLYREKNKHRARSNGTAHIDAETDRAAFIQTLNPRRLEILMLIKDGLKQVDIAEKLNISPSAVNQHINAIKEQFKRFNADRPAPTETADRPAPLLFHFTPPAPRSDALTLREYNGARLVDAVETFKTM